MKAMPMMAGKSKRCLKNIHATADTNTMPMPDQMAYITPVGMWRMVSDKK